MKLDNLQYDNSTVTMCMIDKIDTRYPQNQNVGSILHLVYSIHFEKLQDLTAHKQVDKIKVNSKTSKNTYAYKPLKIVLPR